LALNKRKLLDAARKHAQKGAKAKALKEYNKLLKKDPHDAKLLLEVGDAYRRWGQNEEAITQYGKVAQQYRQDGFDARAVAVLKQILKLDSKNYGAYVTLSDLYQRMGLDSEAVAALQTAADGYRKEGRKTEALDLLRQMAALDPTNTTSRLKVAELLRQEGMESEAVAEYEAVTEELESQNDRDQLVTVLGRILEVKPDNIGALTGLVRQLMVAGELDRAEPLAVRALNIDASAPQFELSMDLYAQMGDEVKLVDATRGLAKLYRDRGDEEKARELMQRLPVEEVGSSSRLAVDVSEVEEPDLEEEELLDDDEEFLSLEEKTPDSSLTADPEPELDEEPVLDPEADDEIPEFDPPLPEGDPDQLLAEASVYLRYGKRDQAIASLRGILAQEPSHRAALEKLGEAYAEDGQQSEAIAAWMRAAEQIRAECDAGGLAVLKDRIASLDPAMADQIGGIDPAGAPEPSLADVEPDVDEPSTPAMDLDLDVEVELELEGAIAEVAASETQTGYDFGNESDDFEIELDEDSVTLGGPSDVTNPSASADASLVVEETGPEFEPDLSDDGAAVDDAEDFEFEFEVESGDLRENDEALPVDDEKDVSVEFACEGGEPTQPPSESAAGQSAAMAARTSEELEEAEFYIAQGMYDEAEGILQRILDAMPAHPAAMLRMGEVAAAKGGEPCEATTQSGVESKAQGPNLEIPAAFDDDEYFEVEVDFDDADEELVLDDASDEGQEVEVDDASDEGQEVEVESSDAARDDDTEVVAREAVEDAEAEDAEPADAAESFDLRQALADVLEDDGEPKEDPNATSSVQSTVEDGFASIFSDFKKGVTETLDEGDFDTRYDLGIAYREMGLYDDAIAEFRFCLDSPNRRFDSLYLMGLCARDLARHEDAVSHLEQALALPDLPEDRMAGVYFDLSIAEEGVGDLERASGSMRRVLEIDPEFPGAADRLAALETGETTTPELGEPGEAFESFDDLFEDDDDEGDGALAEVVGSESFDDVVSEAEVVLDDAEFVPEATAPAEREAEVSADETERPNNDDAQTVPRKVGRKNKISFV